MDISNALGSIRILACNL